MTFDIGDLIELTGAFTDPDTGEAVDPDAVTCTVLEPDGEEATPEATGEGTYAASFEATEAGKHRFAFDGTGANQASAEGIFTVRKRQVPRA
jgi:hypothetical protein